MRTVELPPTLVCDRPTAFHVRQVPVLRVAAALRRGTADLNDVFEGDEVLVWAFGATRWYVGRSPEWTRAVIGSAGMWADVDVLRLGLGRHPTYYAMGGIPGAPPGHHRQIRQTALAHGFRARSVEPSTLHE